MREKDKNIQQDKLLSAAPIKTEIAGNSGQLTVALIWKEKDKMKMMAFKMLQFTLLITTIPTIRNIRTSVAGTSIIKPHYSQCIGCS